MNDKNFIEELRQKREEYGVTQTRLAVACGISREYYNRIEKGKQSLNDELKEVIEKQIERFNPQEPLFLLIDYFRVRFPTTDALAIIRDVLQLKSDYMLYEDYGKYGYESKYILGDINIMCSMQEHLGVLLELKGRGCRQMESYLLAQERSWYDFILDCMTAGGVMKRLDLAINDKAGILDIPKLKEKYKAGECISYFRKQKDYSGTEKCGSDLPKNTGETLYLGSTSRACEKITERNFIMLSGKYQNEQIELEQQITSLREELSKMEQDMIGAEKWIELIKEYSVPKELTAPLLNAMIEKILIHEATTNADNERIQEIEIYYRFIGKVD